MEVLMRKDGGIAKVQPTEAIPLRSGAKKELQVDEIDWNSFGDDEDDLIDENTLLSEQDLTKP